MKNNFVENIKDEKYFYSLIEDIENSKVGFYSVGLYPASLAYNCAMHGKSNNILLAPREDRDLLGAFSNDVISDMDNEIIEKIKRMGNYSSEGKIKSFDLKDLLLKCEIVILASNSNHIQDDVKNALELRKNLKRENVVLGCLVGSFCIDNKNKNPFILCNKYPNLAFFTGFHRHGALRNPNDSFTANFCHPDALTALIGARILNQLSPKIQVSPGVHNIECQYIKSIKNISSIFAGFVNNFHSDKPGMLPTINTILLTQCLDQAASVSIKVRKENKLENKYLSLKELGYGEEIISAREIINDKFCEKGDYTFSQLNAVKADVLGSMTLPTEGKPTRNFQAGQVLSDMLLQLNRCPKDVLCFNANSEEKKEIYKVLISSEEITNFCQESVKSELSFELNEKLKGDYLFDDIENFYKKLFIDKEQNALKTNKYSNQISKKNPSYINVLKIINKYFNN